MSRRKLPDLSPAQVVKVQDALLANADRLLTSALAVLKLGNVGLARSMAILGMEESGKAIAIHERRVQMVYAPEGEPFVNEQLSDLWASHQRKLELVYDFLVEERYWFDTGPSDPAENRAYLGTIKRWTRRHDNLKQRGFYVDLDKAGDALTPEAVADEEPLADVIEHVHQVGWQLRLGEHIEAKGQAQQEQDAPPASVKQIERMREVLAGTGDEELIEDMLAGMREGVKGKRLNNDAYRLRLPDPESNPFENLGKPGYQAETRELMRMMDEREGRERRGASDLAGE